MLLFNHTTTSNPGLETFSSHMHNDYELFYLLRGDADYVIEGATYRLRPHDLLLIRPRTYHHLIPRSSAPYERTVINFTSEELPPLLRPFLHTAHTVYNLEDEAHLLSISESWIIGKARLSKEEFELLLRQTLPSLLLFLSHTEAVDELLPVQRNPKLEQILAYIDHTPAEQHTASTLSARFFVSSSWIVHSFRRHLGVTLQQYVSRKRMLYAQRLLRRGTPATETAQLCGFDSYTTFYRQYLRVLGVSPQKDLIHS